MMRLYRKVRTNQVRRGIGGGGSDQWLNSQFPILIRAELLKQLVCSDGNWKLRIEPLVRSYVPNFIKAWRNPAISFFNFINAVFAPRRDPAFALASRSR